MTAKVYVTNKSNTIIKQIQEKYESELKSIVFQAATKVKNDAILNIRNGTKSGREYKRGNIVHKASAAGEYPATDTGLLWRSIAIKFYRNGLEGVVQTDSEYAAHLEFGTKNMSARPFLQPSLEAARPMVRKFLKSLKAKL